MRVQMSITAPMRSNNEWESWAERWEGPDKGLILCWQTGRRLRLEQPAVAKRAEAGELVSLPWKGGTEGLSADPKKDERVKAGTLYYLAMWQGLRGEDLEVDLEGRREILCSRAGVRVIFRAGLPEGD